MSDRAQIAALGTRQPHPLFSEGDVWQEVIDRLPPGDPLRPRCEARRLVGIERYGSPLQRGNGRDNALDLEEEALDLLAYAQAERDPRVVSAALAILRHRARQAAVLP
jgi:hypothetical protein